MGRENIVRRRGRPSLSLSPPPTFVSCFTAQPNRWPTHHALTPSCFLSFHLFLTHKERTQPLPWSCVRPISDTCPAALHHELTAAIRLKMAVDGSMSSAVHSIASMRGVMVDFHPFQSLDQTPLGPSRRNRWGLPGAVQVGFGGGFRRVQKKRAKVWNRTIVPDAGPRVINTSTWLGVHHDFSRDTPSSVPENLGWAKPASCGTSSG